MPYIKKIHSVETDLFWEGWSRVR